MPSPKRQRKPAPRRQLTVPAILDAALKLVDNEGLDALTMRRLADELDASPMSLYRYIRTRDEIVEGLADLALEQLDIQPPADLTWQEQLRQIFTGIHDVLLAHPGLIHILEHQPVTAEHAFTAVERLLAILRKAGFSGSDAVATIAALESYTFGFTLQQRARAGTDQHDHLTRLQHLPPDQFPNTVELANEFGTWASETHFAHGLQRLLTGIQHDLSHSTTPVRAHVS
jgi:AcrR family transcriptional regulator